MLANGSLSNVIFHEMGHVLGIGTLWGPGLKNLVTGVGTADPRYTGANAVAAYKALGGPGTSIPVENTGGAGTAGAHWRETVFTNEIMTGFLNTGTNPASSISVASLADLGYTVDLTKSDAYLIPGFTPPGGIPPAINGSISGVLFTDADNDGTRDDAETGVGGRVVYIDTNNNARPDAGERFTTSASDGSWSFGTLIAGTYTVRVVLPAGTVATSSISVTLEAGQASTANAIGAFNTLTSFGGVAFNDLNNNGTRDDGEQPLASRAVFIDTNNDGIRQTTERAATTNSSGVFNFEGLAAGTYTLRLVRDVGVSQTGTTSVTLAPGERRADLPLGAFDTRVSFSGVLFSDLDNDATRDDGEPVVAGRLVYLDTNNDGVRQATERAVATTASGTYAFVNLLPGTYNVRVVLAERMTLTTPVQLTLDPAQAITGRAVGFYDANATLSGVVFLDANNNTTRDTGEVALARTVVFLDADDDGIRDTNERFATTGLDGSYSFTGLASGTYKLRAVVAPGLVASTGVELTLAEAQAVTQFPLGLYDTRGSVSGVVFNDLNNDGLRDSNELPIANRVVFLDTNNDGIRQLTERAATTTATGAYAFTALLPGDYNLRVVTTSIQPQSTDRALTIATAQRVEGRHLGLFDSTVSLSGVVYNDLDKDGTRDTGETGSAGRVVFLDTDNDGVLDLTERRAVTNAAGAYLFPGLLEGSFTLRLLLPANGSVELVGAPGVINAPAGAKLPGNDFALFDTNGSLAGTVYLDVNRNGLRDSTDRPLASRPVFLDTNDNGLLDPGERSALTNTNGQYLFTAVPAGQYKVRTVVPTTLTVTQSPTDNTVTVEPYRTITATPIGLALAQAVQANAFSKQPVTG
jgi:protocatechuate 3,4-dioxygenase beta subunit